MICYNCGRQVQNETANFCEYCGASFREQAQAIRSEEKNQVNHTSGIHQGTVAANDANQRTASNTLMKDNPIGFMSWLGTYAILGALLMIPYLGWLGFIALLLFWAFNNKTPATKRNWARVTLIFVGIVMVFLIIAVMTFMSLYYNQIVDGTFDFNSYYNSMMNSLQK